MTTERTTEQWDPATHPFRVVWVRHSSQPGLYGWATDRVATYASLAEALDQARTLFGANVFQVDVDEALFTTTWQRDGRWKALAKRKRKQALVITRYGQARLAALPEEAKRDAANQAARAAAQLGKAFVLANGGRLPKGTK